MKQLTDYPFDYPFAATQQIINNKQIAIAIEKEKENENENKNENESNINLISNRNPNLIITKQQHLRKNRSKSDASKPSYMEPTANSIIRHKSITFTNINTKQQNQSKHLQSQKLIKQSQSQSDSVIIL